MRIASCTLVMMLLTAASQAQVTHPAGVTSCIARWDFKNVTPNQISDVSNNNHDGNGTNVMSGIGFRSRQNEAGIFNGINSKVTVAHSAQLNPQNITIVSLVKFNGFYQGDCQTSNIIYKGISYYTPGNWSMHITDGLYDGNCNSYNPSKMQLDFAGASSVSYTVPASNYVALNTWYFLATSYDGATVKRYMIEMDTSVQQTSLIPISTSVLNTNLGTNNNDLVIGATQNPSYPFNVNGSIDEIALFNRALSDIEITTIYKYFWNLSLGIDEVSIEKPVSIVATNGIVTISLREPYYGANIFITNILGHKIFNIKQLNLIQSYDLSDHTNSVVIVRCEKAGITYSTKIWIE